MRLELAQVRHVAKLARLSLSPEEEATLTTQLSVVLEAVEALATVDTEGVPATTIALPSATHVRSDEVGEELAVEAALKNAPHQVEACFAIPRVIE